MNWVLDGVGVDEVGVDELGLDEVGGTPYLLLVHHMAVTNYKY
jgi:hypothetical protein